MPRGRKLRRLFAVLFSLLITTGQKQAFAERPSGRLGQWLQQAGIYTGYAKGALREPGGMEVITLGCRFGFDLKPFTKKFGFDPPGMLELIWEPFLGGIVQPEGNVELGLAFLLRYSYPLTRRIYPFVEAGTGVYYMTLATVEQSTQFNCNSQGGGGLIFFLTDDLALTLGYRFRHISNGWLGQPNSGINGDVYLVSLSHYY